MLDARDIPGGGATTEEVLLPGYKIDTCATGHTLIRVNPLLTRDELGLIGDYGLRYLDPDPVAHVAFPDGEQLTMWLDKDRAAAEIARFRVTEGLREAEPAHGPRRVPRRRPRRRPVRRPAPGARLGVAPDADRRPYQTGATTHPGGSITGAPARNAAMVLLDDLGHDPADVLSPGGRGQGL